MPPQLSRAAQAQASGTGKAPPSGLGCAQGRFGDLVAQSSARRRRRGVAPVPPLAASSSLTERPAA